MGQKINPIANRLGIVRGWDSNWYGGNNFGDTLLEDTKIREYVNAKLSKAIASVSKIVIERTLKLVTITVCSSRPLERADRKLTSSKRNSRRLRTKTFRLIFLKFVNQSWMLRLLAKTLPIRLKEWLPIAAQSKWPLQIQ